MATGIIEKLLRNPTNVQTGSVNAPGSTAAGTYIDYDVEFPTAFNGAPYVFIQPTIDPASVSLDNGKLFAYVYGRTTTGFKLRMFNNSSITRGLSFEWLAILL